VVGRSRTPGWCLYLSPEHREQRADGCPSAALLDEVVRRPPATKKVFSGGLMSIVDEIASRLDPTDVEAARGDALTLYGLLIGTLQLARSLTTATCPIRSWPAASTRR
jgi:TetR/AcrR family transcriptional regulator, transcriptional repressor for nem operon